jgi:hypothetical protein
MRTSVHSGGTGNHPAFPHANGFTAYGALLATNSCCHRRRRIDGFARPVGLTQTFADLTPATGARTTRFCRPQQCRSSRTRESLTGSHPPCNPFACTTSSRPPHPTPTFVTIAIRPSFNEAGCRDEITYFGKTEENYFCVRTGHANHVEPAHEIRSYAHAILAAREPRGRSGAGKIELIFARRANRFSQPERSRTLTTSGTLGSCRHVSEVPIGDSRSEEPAN